MPDVSLGPPMHPLNGVLGILLWNSSGPVPLGLRRQLICTNICDTPVQGSQTAVERNSILFNKHGMIAITHKDDFCDASPKRVFFTPFCIINIWSLESEVDIGWLNSNPNIKNVH